MKKEFLEGGRVCNAHGVRGLLKAEAWCDSPKVLAAQKRIFFAEKDGTMKECKITRGSVASGFVLLGIEGIETREDAIALKNKVFYLKREDIPVPEGAYLIADLIGLPVIDIHELQAKAERITGKPQPVPHGDKVVAEVIYRDGTIIDRIYNTL